MKPVTQITSVLIIAVFLLGFGTVYFHETEGWSYTDAFYFSTMTLTTIGYGDLTPSTNMTKIFTSFYAIFGVGLMLYILSSILHIYLIKEEEYIGALISSFNRLTPTQFRAKLKKNKDKGKLSHYI